MKTQRLRRACSGCAVGRGQWPWLLVVSEVGPGRGLLGGALALRGEPVVASLDAVPGVGSADDWVECVRVAVGEVASGLCSVSSLSDVLVVRALAGRATAVACGAAGGGGRTE